MQGARVDLFPQEKEKRGCGFRRMPEGRSERKVRCTQDAPRAVRQAARSVLEYPNQAKNEELSL
jgi:hypothetical protein